MASECKRVCTWHAILAQPQSFAIRLDFQAPVFNVFSDKSVPDSHIAVPCRTSWSGQRPQSSRRAMGLRRYICCTISRLESVQHVGWIPMMNGDNERVGMVTLDDTAALLA